MVVVAGVAILFFGDVGGVVVVGSGSDSGCGVGGVGCAHLGEGSGVDVVGLVLSLFGVAVVDVATAFVALSLPPPPLLLLLLFLLLFTTVPAFVPLCIFLHNPRSPARYT